MKLDLDAIKERCEAASGEPWSEWTYPDGTYRIYGAASWGVAEMTAPGSGLRENDMKFIAYARADVPALVAEVERLRASLEEILDEATSDLDRDIIITECQSALTEEETQ